MTTPTYTPRAGSLASQVIGFFRHNPDEELLLDDITDKFDATRGNIHTLLKDAVEAALLARYRNADGDYVYKPGAACGTYATPDVTIAATVAKTKAADAQMTTININKLLLEQVQDLLYRVTRWKGENHEVLTDLHDIKEAVKAALAAPATAPDDRVKELKAELAATEIAIAEYRQQCLDNATEIARLRSESEERLQNCAALVAENEQLRWAVKDALAQLQRGDFADAESTLSVTAMKETP